jgi:L-iditol 2-dehydrogenase
MKAVVVESPGKIKVKEVLDPILGEYDVLCKTLASSVCGGTDNHIIDNHLYFKVKYPLILGHEGVGKVLKSGPKTKYLKVGDVISRIMNKLPEDSDLNLQYGAFAELSIATDWQAMRDDGLPKDEWKKYTVQRVLPADFDPIESTMIITWRETFSFLSRMNLRQGESALIIGSGANALAFANHLDNLGLNMAVIGSSKRQEDFLKFGIEQYISYKEKNKKIKRKIDIVIDTIGQGKNLDEVIENLLPNGKIGLYGLDAYEDYCIKATKAPYDFSFFNGKYYDEGSAHEAVIEMIKTGKLNSWNYLSKEHIYNLADIELALEAGRNGKVLKSVIKFD